MTSSFGPLPRLSSRSRATPTAWVWNSASSPCSTPGDRTSTSIPTCTAWFPAAVCRWTTTAGFQAAAASYARYLAPFHQREWVVYAKPPFGGPQRVLEYLGRYTHRVAISNRRLLALENNAVSFDWKDYRDGQQKVMTVAADEFIRRFLQHSLPSGLQRIRYYGFLANCHRAAKLELCRQLLATAVSALLPQPDQCRDFIAVLTGNKLRLCPRCGIGILASMASAVVARRSGRSIFWPESLALIFFAWSWLVKGQALGSIKSTLGAAKDRATK